MKYKKEQRKWLIIGVVVLALILIPFGLFGEVIESWTQQFLSAAKERPFLVAMVLGGLLASDILLPVPSSIVSTACGLLLGFGIGTAVSVGGMMVSCAVGYALADTMGKAVVGRFVGPSELARLQHLNARFGSWIVIICRPVPVLAEASVLFLGMGGMPRIRFFTLCALSNLGISVVYAAMGAWSASVHSFFIAVGASILVPWAFMMLMRGTKGQEADHDDH